MKKIIVLLLAIILSFPVEAELKNGKCGENLTYTFDTNTGILKIEGSGAMVHSGGMYDFDANDLPWSSYSDSILEVVLPEGLTIIGAYAFYGCSNLVHISFPQSVKRISPYAFYGCSGLTSITIPGTLKSIGRNAFEGCTGLLTLNLSEGVMEIDEWAFESCSGISTLTIPGTVKEIGICAFDRCSGLTSVIIHEGCCRIQLHAFYGCTDLKSISIPFAGTQYGYHFGYLFEGKSSFPSSLQKITFTGSKITRGAFDGVPSKVHLYVTNNLKSIAYDAGNGWTFGGLHVEDVNEWAKVNYLGYNGLPATSITKLSSNLYEGENLLETVNLEEGLTEIKPFVFYGFSNIKNINVSTTVKTIGDHAFTNCTNLETCVLPTNSQTEVISEAAFSGCTSLKKMDLPTSVTAIGKDAFRNCSAMTEVKLPSSITSIGDYAFNGCSALNDVYTYTIEPQQIDQNTFSTYETAILHCPKVSYYDYFYNTQWSQFLHIANFDEPYTYVHIVNDFELQTSQTGTIDGEPRVDIDAGGGLTVKGDQQQRFGDVHISYTAATQLGASLIGNNNLTAQKLFIDITVGANKWYFFSFPYNIDCTQIEKSGSYIFRKYDGNVRATNGSGGWVDLAADEKTLYAGTGYIFQTNTAGVLSLPVTAPDLAAMNATTNLNSYASANAANSNWNFCGNRYISYFNINDLQYESPIVVWDGTKYVAYRPGDDEYVITPFQAFFVQSASASSTIGFTADGRTTYLGSQNSASAARARRAKAMRLNPDRLLINLVMSDGVNEDKCRVVFNDQQLMAYEIGCDASKFADETQVSLIYSLDDDNIMYAINERPKADGRVRLGVQFLKSGEYTISAPRMDMKMWLVDTKTGIIHDFEDGDYTFTGEVGISNNRFYLIPADEATGINNVPAILNQQNSSYDLNGRPVYNANKGIRIENGKKILKK